MMRSWPRSIRRRRTSIVWRNWRGRGAAWEAETKAPPHYTRAGDVRALGGAQSLPSAVGVDGFMAASNDPDMNIGTAADGGNAVPTGHYQGIIAKRDEMRLSGVLGVTPIPGVGTTAHA